MKRYYILFILITGSLFTMAQYEPSKFELNGYLSGMPQLIHSSMSGPYIDSNIFIPDTTITSKSATSILHNRLNLFWYPTDKITATVQLRNQYQYGELIAQQNYETGFANDNYYLPLTFRYADEKALLSMAIDRLWLQYTYNNIDVKLGRQRINWGLTFAWNPHDIFNSFNFFDFDYVERPGADALRVIYYPGMTSSIDLAAKVDSAANVTAAGLFKFNKWNTDFQILAGYLSSGSAAPNREKDEDLVLGLGFTGDVKGLSLRGEGSYFIPLGYDSDTSGLLVASIGLDYSFPLDIYTSCEFLYTNKTRNVGVGGLTDMYDGPMTVKTLAIAKYNFMLQGSYPLTPLINLSIAGMYFADDNLSGFYTGPTIAVSIKDNLDLSMIYQYFNFTINMPQPAVEFNLGSHLGFLRLKYSF